MENKTERERTKGNKKEKKDEKRWMDTKKRWSYQWTERDERKRKGEKKGGRRNTFTLTDTATGRESRIPHSKKL